MAIPENAPPSLPSLPPLPSRLPLILLLGVLLGLAACSHEDDQSAHRPYYHYGWYYYGG